MPPLDDLPIDRFCNFLWWWRTKDMQDEGEYFKFEAKIYQPIKGQPTPTTGPWSPEAETARLSSLKATLGA